MKIKRRFLDKLEEGELDIPDRGIGWRNMLVVNKRTGKSERVYEKVEYHTVWETAFLIGVAGKPMDEANVRKLCREGKLKGVKFNSIIEDYVSGDAVKLLNTVPWEVPVWALREYFEKNGLVDAGRGDMPQVPDVAPCPVVAPVRTERPQVPDVAPGPVVAPVRAERPQVPDMAPGPVVAPVRAERPQVPAGVAPDPVVIPPQGELPRIQVVRAAAPIRAKSHGAKGRWLVVAVMVCVVLACCILTASGLFTLDGNTNNPPTSTPTSAPKNVCEEHGFVLCPDGLACCARR